MIEEIIWVFLILFYFLSKKGRGFQHTGRNMSGLHIMVYPYLVFCFSCIDICDHPHISWTTLILSIQIRITVTNKIVLMCLLMVKNVHTNQSSPPQNHFRMFTQNLMVILILVIWSRAQEQMREKIFGFVHVDLTSGVSTMKKSIIYISSNFFTTDIFFLFFFWSGLRDHIACSLLGVGIKDQNSGYKVTRLCTSSMLSCYFVPPPSFLACCCFQSYSLLLVYLLLSIWVRSCPLVCPLQN